MRPTTLCAAGSALGAFLLAVGAPVLAQKLDLGLGVDVSAFASTNPDLLPRGQEQGDMWLEISPFFSVSGTVGEKFTVNGSGSVGLTARLSLNDEDSLRSFARPSGDLTGTWEAVDNFFFVDVRAAATSQLDDPFLATTDPTSPFNTSTSYQFGVAPYLRGEFAGDIDYEIRSDNSWTNFADSDLQYSMINSVRMERRPQPFGGVFSFTQTILDSDIEGQPRLVSDVARLSLRYSPDPAWAVGVRGGAERYNNTLVAREWQSFYGAELSWRPNSRISAEGYWEDRIFGNSWQASVDYRRPRSALFFRTSRTLTSTPQQFATFPGLENLATLLDASFATRIPDPVERRRAVTDTLRQSQLPTALLQPVLINSEGFQVVENYSAGAVLNGQRDSIGFNVFWDTTESRIGIAAGVPATSKTQQRGAEATYNRRLWSRASLNATASWRDTENQLDASQKTTQTQLRLRYSWRITERIDGNFGARYQWVRSTVTNDAVETAVFATLTYNFDL